MLIVVRRCLQCAKTPLLRGEMTISRGGVSRSRKALVSIGTLQIKRFSGVPFSGVPLSVSQTTYDASIRWYEKQKVLNRKIEDLCLLSFVGMTRFELATTRPPDVYSNRAELHPEFVLRCKDNNNFFNCANLFQKKCNFVP